MDIVWIFKIPPINPFIDIRLFSRSAKWNLTDEFYDQFGYISCALFITKIDLIYVDIGTNFETLILTTIQFGSSFLQSIWLIFDMHFSIQNNFKFQNATMLYYTVLIYGTKLHNWLWTSVSAGTTNLPRKLEFISSDSEPPALRFTVATQVASFVCAI